MAAPRPKCRVVVAGVALAFALLFVARGPAAAADRADWPALAGTIFRVVGDSAITSTTAITQDDRGFLWAGSQSGLFRWDGYQLRMYEPGTHVSGALPDAFVNALLCDRRGQLWIGTTSGGLARYAPDRDRFITYGAGANGPSSNTVNALAGDNGGIWIGTSAGLDFRADSNGAFRHFRHNRNDPASLPDNSVRAVLVDRSGAVWVATDGGLARAERGTHHFARVPFAIAPDKGAIALSLFEDSAGRMWVGTVRHGLLVVDPGGATAHAIPRLRGAAHVRDFLNSSDIQAIVEPRAGIIWAGTSQRGVLSLDVAAGDVGWIHNEPDVPTSLPQNAVLSMYRDRSGIVWVGTLSGLSRHDTAPAAFSTIMISSRAMGGIDSPDVSTMYAPRSGPLWLGYGSDGIDLVDPLRGRVGAFRSDPTHPATTLPDSTSRAIVGTSDGSIFMSAGQRIYRTSASGAGLRAVASLPPGFGTQIGALCWTGDRLWIGTVSEGIWWLDPHGRGGPHRFRTRMSIDARVNAIAPAPGGDLWVATYRGLDRVDPRTEHVTHIAADPADPGKLPNSYVSALLTDRRGRTWVGTLGGGLAIMDRRARDGRARFHRIGTAQGLPNANIDALVADRSGRIWVSTDNGLAVIDAATFAVRRFDRADGVELTGYYLGASTTLPNGDLAFGANRGFTVVHPDRLRDWTYRPPVVVTDIRAGGHTLAADGFNDATARVPIVVRPDANSLTVEFAALDYSSPEHNRYAYRLAGFDADWIETDASRRLATYTNLPPGNYQLDLRGSNRTGVWSTAHVALAVRVLPAWHQTLLMHLAELLAALVCVTGLVQLRTAVVRRHERALEVQVAQRTIELERTTRDLLDREQQLRNMAYHDALTDLPNRRMFTDECRRLLAAARRGGEEVALLLIDLDRFKHVNDTLGHDAGDALLVEAAIRLAQLIRESDCVARLGGDEFAILLAGNRDAAAIEGICERIVAAFETPVQFGDVLVKTTPSIGVAVFPQHGTTPDHLYKSADLALYGAKLAGRNTWRRREMVRT